MPLRALLTRILPWPLSDTLADPRLRADALMLSVRTICTRRPSAAQCGYTTDVPRGSEDAMVLNGSCLCGSVRFTVTGELGTTLNCHCRMCRKAHAAAFRTRVAVRRDSITWQSGEHLIRRYESSPTTIRTFCDTCGTRLMSEFADDPDVYGMPLALLDGDPAVRPEMHIFVASKAPWHEITDDLPQFSGMPPSAV